MTVKELIEELQLQDPDAPVLLYLSGSEDCEGAREVTVGGSTDFYCKSDHPADPRYGYDAFKGRTDIVHITS